MLELFPNPAEGVRDEPLEEVLAWLLEQPRRAKTETDLETTFLRAIRQAIDEVIDGRRTGRFAYEELERQEKSYIGTRIEIVVRTAFELEPEGRLDTVIAGHPVDFKWSAKGGWMIPTEAVGELCLLLKGDETKGTFSVGLVRCEDAWLNPKPNKDGKRTISKAGKKNIRWLVKDGPLPTSFLTTLDPETSAAVFARPAGQARVRELFERVTGRPVPREVICTLAMQEDPMRRIRQDAAAAAMGGVVVFGGRYKKRREAAKLLGYGPLGSQEYISVPIEELRSLPEDLQRELGVEPEAEIPAQAAAGSATAS
jgi:hypothetical protein